MTNSPHQTRNAVIGILLTCVLLYFALYANKLFFGVDANHSNALWLLLSRIYIWIILGVIFLYAAKVERQPFLLWKNKKYRWWKIILFAISILIIYSMINNFSFVIFKHFGIDLEKASPQTKLIACIFKSNIPLLVLTCITAGITEELLFRGYLLPRLIQVSKSPVFAIIFSALLFTAGHIGWSSWREIIGPFCMGVIFAVFYWKYRNINLLIALHFIIDIIATLNMVHPLFNDMVIIQF